MIITVDVGKQVKDRLLMPPQGILQGLMLMRGGGRLALLAVIHRTGLPVFNIVYLSLCDFRLLRPRGM